MLCGEQVSPPEQSKSFTNPSEGFGGFTCQ